jgi:hypothetical protein
MLKQSHTSVLPFSAIAGTISGLIFIRLPGSINKRSCHWQPKFPGSTVAHPRTGKTANAKGHVSNILSKLHLADRTQAAVYAWREGVVGHD